MIVIGPRVPLGFLVCQRITRSFAVFAFFAVSICAAAIGSSELGGGGGERCRLHRRPVRRGNG
jgi:hypothetical protein